MSTTTVGDLLTRAHWLTLSLQAQPGPITHESWAAFDATTRRVLRNVIGPPREATEASWREHAELTRMLTDYPNEARICRVRGCHGTGADKPVLPESTSDATLDRITLTLGALADLLQAAREADAANGQRRAALDQMLAPVQIPPVLAQVLTVAVTTTGVVQQQLPPQHKPRPDHVLRHLEHALEAVTQAADRHSALLDLASRSAHPDGYGLNERLEHALYRWNQAAREELRITIPSTDVLRNIANQGIHLYAVTDAVIQDVVARGALAASRADELRAQLRGTATELQKLDKLWGTVTTATRPSREYVQATTDLFKTLKQTPPKDADPVKVARPSPALGGQQALRDLQYAVGDVADLLHQAEPLPSMLARSGLLYAPARGLPGNLRRLRANLLGTLAPMTEDEADDLRRQAGVTASAASHTHRRIVDVRQMLTSNRRQRSVLERNAELREVPDRDVPVVSLG